MDKFLFSIYQKVASHKIGTLILSLLLIGSLVFIAAKIEFEEDITKLIPTNSKNEDAQKVMQTVNFGDKIIVNIQLQSKGNVDDLTKFASAFVDSISSTSEEFIRKIQGKVEDETIEQTLDFVYENLPLFLEEADYKILTQKINADSISAITTANYKTLISPTGFIAKKTILKDPLGLSFIALKKLKQLSFGNDFTVKNGFLLSKDQQNILLFISPKLGSSETSQNALFIKQLNDLKLQLNSHYKEKVVVEYFGGVLIAVANAKQIKHDIQLTVSIALTILLLILILFYKKITIPIILFAPTLFGGLLAVAILFLIRTKISAISLGIGSVLLGVTLDYSLHILTHIRSNNNIKSLYKEIAKPILMSSLTTALAFLCLLFLHSQALQDLGIFAAISVIGSSVFALLFIPQVYKEKAAQKKKNTFIDALANTPLHKNKWVLSVLTLLLIGSLFTYNKVTFNKDLATLNYEPQELKEAKARLDKLTHMESKSVYLAAYSTQKEDALATNDSIYNTLIELKRKGDIIDFSSIGSLIHSQKKQQSQIVKWNSFWSQQTKNKLQNHLIESGNEIGFKTKTFNIFYSFLDSKFLPLEIEDYKALSSFSVEDYIATKNGFTTVITLVKLKDEKTQDLITVFKNQDQTLIIDRKEMNETFLGTLKTDFNRLIKYSLIVVFLILLVFYRSLSLTLVTVIPICLTWLLTIGIMGLFNIPFNIFNIIISTFIFGLGIDYSIFITNGLLHEYRTGEKALSTHKTSIILSVITTILGVGVLIFAKHPALYSISLVSIIGILAAVLVSFSIQPLLFRLFIGSNTKRPITLRLFIHSVLSFTYYGLGGFLLSLFSITVMKIIPLSKKLKMKWFHKVTSKFMGSVLYLNPFVKKTIPIASKEDFKKQAVIISNHTSFLDILAIGMLHPKIIFLVNDWVYNSPVFGKAVQLAGFYPVSSGIENGLSHLQKKVDQGYSLMSFPEGTRSTTNKIKRFHKGAFYLAEQFNLDIVPILIHGNSEVLPKGSFIIKNGSISVKILERIKATDTHLGENYSKKAKLIGAYFRKEFALLRNEIEDETYFHPTVLEEYRYKGDAIFKNVKTDLQENKSIYKKIIDTVGKKAILLHLSKDFGELDFLLILDGPDRNISTFIENKEVRSIFKNSFLNHKHSKLKSVDTIQKVIKGPKYNTVILNVSNLNDIPLEEVLHNKVNTLIVLKENCTLSVEKLQNSGFEKIYEAKSILILKKQPLEKTI